MTQAIHFIDLLQWCIRSPESIYAYIDVKTHNIEVEDTVVAIFSFKGSVLELIESTVSTYSELPRNYTYTVLKVSLYQRGVK